MKKINLTTLKDVSILGLGCMNFGTKTDSNTSFNILDNYIDMGGNFLDTSNNYAFWNEGGIGGESETTIGNWLKSKSIRNQVYIATKVGANPKTAGSGFENIEGLSKNSILKAVDESLNRLQTDYIDLYYAHIDDTKTNLCETLEVFDSLIKTGKVRNIGCSNYSFERFNESINLCKKNNWTKYTFIQNRYTYLQPHKNSDFGIQQCLDSNFLSYKEKHNSINLVAYSPLINGYYDKNKNLNDQYLTPDLEKRMKKLSDIATKLNVTKGQVVLAWLTQNTPKILPLIGTSNIEQLKTNIKSLDIKLNDEELKQLS